MKHYVRAHPDIPKTPIRTTEKKKNVQNMEQAALHA